MMDKTEIPRLSKYSDISVLLDLILSGQRDILGEKLVGLYLYGSMVAGDFDYEISDIDLLAATETVINQKEFAALERMHFEVVRDNPQWEDRIEIQYASLDYLKTFKTQESQIGSISPGEAFHFIEAGRDWLLNWYFVRESSVTLFGASPETIIVPISEQEFIDAVREQAIDCSRNIEKAKHSRPYQAYLIMTVCRALYTVENGKQVSKRCAASWTQKQFPEYFSLIENAFDWRANSRDENVNHEATFNEAKKFVLFILGKIKV